MATFDGVFFDFGVVKSSDFADIFSFLLGHQNGVCRGLGSEFELSVHQGAAIGVDIQPGGMFIGGRYIKTSNVQVMYINDAKLDFVPGMNYIYVALDMTQTNSASGVPGTTSYLSTINQITYGCTDDLSSLTDIECVVLGSVTMGDGDFTAVDNTVKQYLEV